jgi:hypothetical protein
MKNVKLILHFCFVLMLAFSCKKEVNKNDRLENNNIVFGHFYGECFGEQCVEIFKIDGKHIFEDKKDIYPDRKHFYEGNFGEIYPAGAEDVKELRVKFPDQLLNEKDTVIGQPDAGDWGGLYIEIEDNGKHRFWIIDKMKSNIPSYLHSFIDDVNSAIEKLQ